MVVTGVTEDSGMVFVFSLVFDRHVPTWLGLSSSLFWSELGLSCFLNRCVLPSWFHQVVSMNLMFESVTRFFAPCIFALLKREYGVPPATCAHVPN